MVLHGHVKYKICYISTIARPTTTKPGKGVTYYDKFPPAKLRNTLNAWSSKAMCQNKNITTTMPMVKKPGMRVL